MPSSNVWRSARPTTVDRTGDAVAASRVRCLGRLQANPPREAAEREQAEREALAAAEGGDGSDDPDDDDHRKDRKKKRHKHKK
jgi:hypothetical protein